MRFLSSSFFFFVLAFLFLTVLTQVLTLVLYVIVRIDLHFRLELVAKRIKSRYGSS